MKKLLFIIILFSFYGFRSGTENRVYEGIAMDKNSLEFIYKEVHQEIFREGKHLETQTSFVGENGSEFAHRELDFRNSFQKPNYLLMDERSGLLEEVIHLGANQFGIRYQKNYNSKLKEKSIYVPEPAVVDGGFNYYIKNNWNKLMAEEKLVFNFLSVAFQDYFTFRIYKVDEQTNNPNIVVLRMECQKLFLRVLMNPIYVHYDLQSKRISKYEGISNIRDQEGHSYKALLNYPELGP
ncbi:hypothetical protein L3049_12625 [Labilibaculum sp. DW002]|uniref:Uncharacterized protein n=1 Tax=Paralabilibaculum antarcticum TaxID=2912572 RepID=A0ABT5VTU6_9BACT|nr:hypothetical protein [Labilibaculum sp. DW002]MDE5418852.1 hypothetical protein [Labilibaculum sp. DW002]